MAYWMAGAAIGGAVLNYAGSRQQANAANKASKANANAYNAANANQGMPRWSEEQTPYVWGPGYNFATPQLSQQALDYGRDLAAGSGPSRPMDIRTLIAGINNPQGVGQGSLLGYGLPQAPQGNEMWTPESLQPAAPAQPAPQATPQTPLTPFEQYGPSQDRYRGPMPWFQRQQSIFQEQPWMDPAARYARYGQYEGQG